MRRNYFVILCLLLISGVLITQKSSAQEESVPRVLLQSKAGNPLNISFGNGKAKGVPDLGENVLLAEDFQNLQAPDYLPAGWENYSFDSGYIPGIIFDRSSNITPSNWLNISLDPDIENVFMVSFSFLLDGLSAYADNYTYPADDW